MKYPAVASLILRTLHTISVLINKKSFLLAHFITRGAAEMQTHLKGWEFTSVIFPGVVGALDGLGRGIRCLCCPCTHPLPGAWPRVGSRNCPCGCFCQAAAGQLTVKPGQNFLGSTTKDFPR